MHNTMSSTDLMELRKAKYLLEHVSFANKIINTFGRPVEWTISHLPKKYHTAILNISHKSIARAMDYACWTLPNQGVCWKRLHMTGAMAAGAVGGYFGIASLSVELPISTVLMLRSIAEIARTNGESLYSPETRLACIQVLALGGKSPEDDAMDAAYLTLRAALANEMRLAAAWLTTDVTRQKAQPLLVRLIQTIAARFSIVVKEKVIVQAVPVIGAVGGATINATFMDHFQDKAEGHFTFRRLERKYGPDVVEEAYRKAQALSGGGQV
jgi:hypothetical protein